MSCAELSGFEMSCVELYVVRTYTLCVCVYVGCMSV